ncbi:energy-coupling factor transporter transmembrane component T [Flexivirga caeni]|uniref:Energy-coupling factor transporter transmembrane protein EcfT n=1 Tax=Flexivirga caeni TaxID=2294115 RepID=A0A3M9M5B9_9MICO|nr:energy-coupling factor transporter transmembrane component T [Flexivirga caeni]RNI20696.1 energy-coupling factor transporter transmembrane protein EcfT [Flexivirga caeni]
MKRLPGVVHPVAWWLWAIGMAVAASFTTNPLLLLILIGVSCFVVVLRRGSAPWSRSLRVYLLLGLAIVVVRVFFRCFLGAAGGGPVLLDLPRIPLPQWAAGITLLGPVRLSDLLAGLYDGLHLAGMVVCVGAANSLANPKRLLKVVPISLYDIGTVVVVAVSVFPQLADSIGRVRRAQRLRPAREGRWHVVRRTIVPVVADALDRSLLLAAAMDSRGYGRRAATSARTRTLVSVVTVAGLIAVCIGVFGMLDDQAPLLFRAPAFVTGLLLAAGGLVFSSSERTVTRYRPDAFDLRSAAVAASGLAAGALMLVATRQAPAHLSTPVEPAQWPVVDLLPLVAAMIGVLAAVVSPRPVLHEEVTA